MDQTSTQDPNSDVYPNSQDQTTNKPELTKLSVLEMSRQISSKVNGRPKISKKARVLIIAFSIFFITRYITSTVC